MFPAIVLLRFFLSGCRQPWSGPDSIGLSDSLSRLQGNVSNRSQSSKWWRQRDTVVSKEHEQVCIISLCARDLRGNKTKWVGQILLLSCLFLKVICMLIVYLFVYTYNEWEMHHMNWGLRWISLKVIRWFCTAHLLLRITRRPPWKKSIQINIIKRK